MTSGIHDSSNTMTGSTANTYANTTNGVVPDRRSGVHSAIASADANIALIKYWGKADEDLIIPRASSLSLTLDGLTTRTSVEFLDGAADEAADGASASAESAGRSVNHTDGVDAGHSGNDDANASHDAHGVDRDDLCDLVAADTLSIDGKPQFGSALRRVSCFLDIVRTQAGLDPHTPARVVSANTVPYGAGLASSASAFAALAAAASRAAGLDLDGTALSRLARRGSGSACRSIYGGLVKWNAGTDDETSYAEPVDSSHLDLAIVVVTVSDAVKPISSREAMRRTVATSPLYDAWIRSCKTDMDEALAAVRAGDIMRLGMVTESNSLGMHASIMTARPPVMYWMPESVAAMQAVREIRESGMGAWSTMDAGPNVKVLTDGRDAEAVADELRNRLLGCEVAIHRPGRGVRYEER